MLLLFLLLLFVIVIILNSHLLTAFKNRVKYDTFIYKFPITVAFHFPVNT